MKKIILNLVFLSIAIYANAQNSTPTKKEVKPIYTIFQQSDADKALREKGLTKTDKNCAPALPVVKSDDVIFAKRLTRDIYFADQANRYLVPSVMNRNLIDVLLKGIESDSITAYQAYNASLNKLEEPIAKGGLNDVLDPKIGTFSPRQYGDMKGGLRNLGLRIYEDWYFDTNRSEFKSFIFAIGLIYAGKSVLLPLKSDEKDLGSSSIKIGEAGEGMEALFYVNYPTIRNYLCKFQVYHQNEKIRYTFDDIFQLRYFSSLIIEESNPDGYRLADRPDLKFGLDKLLEADRIKKSLIQYEQDLWQN